MAAEIATSGIGGDSRIIANSGEFILSPLRIVPLCIASSQYPELKAKLVKAAEAKSRYLPQCMRVDQIVLDTEFFVKIKDLQNSTLTDDDRTFLEAISQGPMSLNEVAEKHNIHPFSINVGKMEELGMVQRIGMTPTDLLHAEGSYVEYDAEASQLGVRYMSRLMRMEPDEFIRVGKLRVMEKIAREILKKLYFEETGELSMDKVAEDLTNKFITGKEGLDYSCSIRLNKPLIGIGAPVRAWLPKVAEWFNTKLLLSEYSHVGNAVGAITGNIIEKIEILIKPFKGEGGSDDPRCTVFASFGRFDVQSYKEAIEFAKTKGGEIATEKAKAAGADTVEVSVEIKEKKFGFDDELGGEMLIETEMTVSAVGKPKEFRQKEGRLSYYVDLNQRYDMG
jgi:N-methylhydantoinase A/oxoprolinase/acetone carboxylase beta subunit